MSLKKIIISCISGIALIFLIAYIGKLAEDVQAGEIVVIQDPIDGELHVFNQPGLVSQNFGKVTHYKKSFQYWFSSKPEDGSKEDQSIKVRFNDGGHAQLSGSIRVDMPLDEKSILALHTRYGSQEAIEHALIGQLITKSVYMTGPMMSSKESNSEKRTQLLGYIEDQAINGIYRTFISTTKVKDPMDDKQERTISVVQILQDTKGVPLRQEVSAAKEFNLRLYNLTINSIDYDKGIETQMQDQQKLVMQINTAVAQAKTAEQQAFTAEKQGEAEAAKAKWAQNTLNAQIIAEAEGRKLAADQDALAAAAEKRANILRGEGEGAYKRAVMQANGALEQKLDTYKEVQKFWADAFSKYTGAIVPQFSTGNQGVQGNGGVNFMELMSAKAAKDLSLDLSNKK